MDSSIKLFSRISGTGMYVPEKVVANDYFASYLETSDEWIRERTGISERRWVEPGTSASDLAEPAAREAIKRAGIKPEELGAIIVATSTPDYVFPSTACMLQKRLQAGNCMALDVSAACSGFVYVLELADGLIAAGRAKHVLVLGAEVFSTLLNHEDRSTVVLFGDGAGAAVVSAVEDEHVDLNSSSGIYASRMYADGGHAEILCVPQGSAWPLTKERFDKNDYKLTMAGREVFKLAVRGLVDVSKEIVEAAGVTLDDVDWYISHQANERILSAVGKQLGLPNEKVLLNVGKYGNTSAATIPILLAESVANGTVKEGDLVLLSAFGGGLTWGATLLRM